jgi:predicted ATPase/DNA-binding CsgD family transcriptional regulator
VSHPLPTETLGNAANPEWVRDDRCDSSPGGVPAALHPLIGRAHELATLRRLATSDVARLVTMTGPGGVGKTRLALALAAEIGATCDTAVAYVGLASVQDGSLVAAAIADGLDIHESGARPLVDDVMARLRGDRFLLILDNFEHLLPAAALVVDLLGACPELQVLVTSRRRLEVSGEHEIPVPPLPLADPERSLAYTELAAVPAIELFVARAQAASPSFTLTEANCRQIAEICQRLDGLPLAIELAAARTRLLTPAALLARLTNRLPLLSGGPRDVPERRQTMRQAIAWSYDLLDPAAQALLRRLSVFAGGFSLDAAEAVSLHLEGASGATSILDRLTVLVDESLVQIGEQPGGEKRFQMLETVRDFLLERLEEAGEASDARRRHAAFSLQLVERVDPWLAMLPEAIELFQTEHDNLRAALGWAIARDPETALRVASGLWRFWSQRGYWSEGRSWLEQALAAGRGAPPELRAAALIGSGRIAWAQADFAHAGRCFDEGFALATASGNQLLAARALQSIGIVASNQGQLDRAAEVFGSALERFRLHQDAGAIGRCLTDLGLVADRRGDALRAIAYYEEALPIARETGDVAFGALLLGNLGGAWMSAGDPARGEALYTEALDQTRILDDQFGVAVNLYNLADCLRDRGAIAAAWEQCRESLLITETLGERHLASRILDRLGLLATIAGLPRPAGRLLGAAAALRTEIGDTLYPIEEASVAEAIALTRAALGDEAFRAAWDVGQTLPSDLVVAEAMAIVLPPAIDERRAAEQAQRALGLSAREVEVLHLVAVGQADKEIASALGISRHTVAKHVAALRAKLDAPSRTGAVNAAREAGVL